jgi:hypothetical protein
MSVLINQDLMPSLLIMLIASSIDTYCNEKSSLSINSFRLGLSGSSCGADKSTISLSFPLYFPSAIPMGLMRKGLKGMLLKGPIKYPLF